MLLSCTRCCDHPRGGGGKGWPSWPSWAKRHGKGDLSAFSERIRVVGPRWPEGGHLGGNLAILVRGPRSRWPRRSPGHLEARDAQSARTVKRIPQVPARICQLFLRMPKTAKSF